MDRDYQELLELGSIGILKSEDAKCVRNCCKNLTKDEIIWIVKAESDRTHSLGIDFEQFDAHADSNKTLLKERKNLRDFIRKFETSPFSSMEYVSLYYKKTKQMLDQVNSMNKVICGELAENIKIPELINIWKRFVTVNEKDNAHQMFLSGDRWETSAHMPVLNQIIRTVAHRKKIGDCSFSFKLARYLLNSDRFHIESKEMLHAEPIIRELEPVVKFADALMTRNVCLASECRLNENIDSVEKLVDKYLQDQESFAPLETKGIVPIFCLDDFVIRHSSKFSLEAFFDSFLDDSLRLWDLVFSYFALKALENEADCFEYCGIYPFSADLLFLRTFNLLKNKSNQSANEFYNHATGDRFSEAFEIVKREIIH